MTFGLQKLFLGCYTTGIFFVKFAFSAEGAPERNLVLGALFTGVGSDISENAGGKWAGEVGFGFFGKIGTNIYSGGEVAFGNFGHDVVVCHGFGDKHFGAAIMFDSFWLIRDIFDFRQVACSI